MQQHPRGYTEFSADVYITSSSPSCLRSSPSCLCSSPSCLCSSPSCLRSSPSCLPHSTGGSSGTSSPLLYSHSPPNSSNLTKVLGAQKIGGTLKSCTVTAVKNAIQRLCPDLPNNLRVRRKLKTNGEKIRWWYIVHGPEHVLSILEQQWEAIKLQTSWNL